SQSPSSTVDNLMPQSSIFQLVATSSLAGPASGHGLRSPRSASASPGHSQMHGLSSVPHNDDHQNF
ncbi:MAG: hypothetical protein M3256_27350, partial [Actinomycetota bacterium]|nr:hypothetical protein [Actinomycetota bacterium]